jgi:DNA-binding transcriptional ArsR family regulator
MLLSVAKQGTALKAKLFRGFADPSRLAILEALRASPLTVTDIVRVTGLSQSNVSNHLGCLRDCGLVTSEQEGRSVRYCLSDPRVAGLLGLGDELLADVARGVYLCTRYGSAGSGDAEAAEATEAGEANGAGEGIR